MSSSNAALDVVPANAGAHANEPADSRLGDRHSRAYLRGDDAA
jgi:hypothetical protein